MAWKEKHGYKIYNSYRTYMYGTWYLQKCMKIILTELVCMVLHGLHGCYTYENWGNARFPGLPRVKGGGEPGPGTTTPEYKIIHKFNIQKGVENSLETCR